jgi:fatty-acyl-CoA synthase
MNIGDWPYKRARTWPDRPFLEENGRTLDNRAFNAAVNRTACGLIRRGVSPGDRVMALMGNSGGFLALLFGCAKIRAIFVPANVALTPSELGELVSDCDPRLLVHSPEWTETAERAAAKAGRTGGSSVPAAELTGNAMDAGAESLEPRERMESGQSMEPAAPRPKRHDPAMILYTSGTAGRPKGAVLTHDNLLFGAIHSLIGYGLDSSCASLVVAPLYHIGALAASVLPVVYAGGRLVLQPFDNPSEIVRLIERERITFLFAVPVMFRMMTQCAAWEAADFSRVHFFIAGGAPMPVSLLRKYREEKGVRFVQGYGMTETGRLTALDLEDAERKSGSVGKEVFHTFLSIADENGEEAAPGQVGEIRVKGPTVCSGYWNRPAETEAAFVDGWFRTGDLGDRDPEGFLYLKGRSSDLIISAGRNIYAGEVERALEALPQVAEAAVTGRPDPRRGEAVAAYVRLREHERPDAARLLAAVRETLAPYKIPKTVEFVEDFPRNGAGKILKRKLGDRSGKPAPPTKGSP